MKKMILWILGVFGVLMVVAFGAGLHTVWPFLTYPVTDIRIERKAPLVPLDLPTMVAGAAVRDITTPIGIPKMGYSAWAREADGFRNRLKARAFYIKPASGEPIAVIQADLPASSLVLHHRVADLIAGQTDVALHNLTLHVTHTHSGPGQFLASDFYNAFGANKPGFDPQVFEFLARQMADAVIEAYTTRAEAKVGIGSVDLYGATKNRSMGAYVRNKNVITKSVSECAAERAVNPTMTMVRIDVKTGNGEFKPLGAFTSFSIHGTGIPPFTKPYHGDTWAFFERELENNIKQHYETPWQPIHGPFEATHGDNNPNYMPGLRGDLETRRIGLMMAEAGWALFQSLDDSLQVNVPISSAMREVDVLNLRDQDSDDLCDRALVGAALVGAAQGDEVFPISYISPFKRGVPKEAPEGCHAEKNIMLSSLQAMGVAADRFPHRVSVSSFQVGDLLVVGLPFEVTFESGNRIALAIEAQADDSINRIVVASHTNGFFGYSTTPEEYSAQWYEGGHTIYGPGTTNFLAKESAKLVADMRAKPGYFDLPEHWHFALASRTFGPESAPASGQRRVLDDPDHESEGNNKEAYWAFQYLDVNPSLLQLHEPLLAIEYRENAAEAWMVYNPEGVPVDDEGYDLQVLHLGAAKDGMSEYEARWFNPPEDIKGDFRFRVEPRGGMKVFYSPKFEL